MKKTLMLISLCVAGQAWAAVGDMVPLPGWKGRQAANGDVIVKMEQVNSTGTPVPTPVVAPGGSNVVLNGISGAAATSYYDKLTTGADALSNNAVVPLKVSSTATTAARYEASATYTTHTTTTINITSTAGTSGRYNVGLRATRAATGGVSLIAAINASATPQATVATLDGRELIVGASDKIYGPCYEAGSHVHIRASGTASVVGTLILEQCK